MANMVRIQNAITEEDHLLNLGEPNDAFLLQHLYPADVITEVYPADLLDGDPEAHGFEICEDGGPQFGPIDSNDTETITLADWLSGLNYTEEI